METIKYGFKFWKKYINIALVIQLCSFLAIVADLFLPLLSELFIDYIILADKTEATGVFSFLINGDFGEVRTFELFFNIAKVFLGLMFIRIILIYIKNTVNAKLGLNMETDLREVTYAKLMRIDSGSIADYNTGELLTTLQGDTIMFKELYCRMIPNMCDSIFVLIITTVILATINPWLILVPVALSPFLIIALIKFRKRAKENYTNIRRRNSEMSLTVQENIEAVRLVRSFTNEDEEKRKFDIANENLKDSHFRQINLSSTFEAVFASIRQFAYIVAIGISTILAMNGMIKIGFVLACASYVMKIMDHVSQINNTLFNMQQQMVSGENIKKFLDYESKIPDNKKYDMNLEKVDIKINNATLVLGDHTILKNINIDIPSGKKIGIVGGTGSGKSVLLKSLIRDNDLTGGEITINGNNIKDYALKDLRNCYSFVFQDVFLFSNTIDSNIAFSDLEIDNDKVVEAAKDAQVHNFIMELPLNYQTIVGERGVGLSGGQKQRVCIARALIRNAPILVLDDVTSALDMNTERALLKTIKEKYPEKTLLISAHKMASVMDCDEIIYLQDGEITERGTFEELMKIDGHFAAIYKVQMAEDKKIITYQE